MASIPLFVWGCGRAPSASVAPSSDVASTELFSVTSNANENPQAVDMALKLAGFSLDEGRQPVMFLNVKEVTVPSNNLDDDCAFQENKPIKTQLANLVQRRVDVHVCPICMKALGVGESDLIEGAKVITRPGLFANINANMAVFRYRAAFSARRSDPSPLV